MKLPQTVIPAWDAAFRMINSAFPPITLFEDVLNPADLEMAYALEAMTNDRLLDQCGVLRRVPVEDRVSGPGSTPVMAAFMACQARLAHLTRAGKCQMPEKMESLPKIFLSLSGLSSPIISL